ncbi:methyltransferase [Staphylothermus hellenicus]|uniref:Methyltransferase small n=1 Tax=Staphylothermus hellenicus (strain DSM 12710 / JCM 10830 / BK20S6-10-b1 / P8) TaxID=591019 RepID=D7DAH3_STAHD|nr:methyltransferase [Staphylothermus hellenicus]ADI31170.1 methyltransferase small [Staphylothermus hellenicus DSM 12710]
METIRDNNYFNNCIDLGCGTGVVGLYLLSKNICSKTVFIDINPVALLNTVYNLKLNYYQHRGLVASISSDSILENYFDLVVANPPYLPGIPENLYDYSLVGGSGGYEAVLEFIDLAYYFLVENGVFYLVYSSLSQPSIIENYLSKKCFRIIRKNIKHFFFEDIIVVEAVKKCMLE